MLERSNLFVVPLDDGREWHRHHRSTFVVPEGMEPTVESVCRSLDGLPLAIARVAANADDLVAARDLLRAADELMPSARHLLGPADRLDADRSRTLIAAGSTGAR